MGDAIAVLARGIGPDGALLPDPRARVQRAVDLFWQGHAPWVRVEAHRLLEGRSARAGTTSGQVLILL